MWQAKKTCLSSRNSANPVIGYYHVRCFENLLDLLSPHYVARFEVDRDEYPPDRGAEDVFEKYISKWKRRLSTTQSASDKRESSKVAGIDKDWAIANRMHEKMRQWLEGQHWRTSNRCKSSGFLYQ